MGKATALAGVGTGGSALAVGGAYATGHLFPNSKEEVAPTQEIPEKVEEETDENQEPKRDCNEDILHNFQPNYWEMDPSRLKGKTLDKLQNPHEKLEPSFFKKKDTDAPQSCLIVNWVKSDYDQNKLIGEVMWAWAYAKGDHGFPWKGSILHKDQADSPLEYSGKIYFVKRQGDGWVLHKYKMWQSTPTFPETITKENFESKFPVVGSAITKEKEFGDTEDLKKHWGLFSSGEDMERICRKSEDDTQKCSNLNTKTSFRSEWKWEPEVKGKEQSDSHKITDWSPNSTMWAQDLYTDPSIAQSMISPLGQLKGKWKRSFLDVKKTNYPIERPSS